VGNEVGEGKRIGQQKINHKKVKESLLIFVILRRRNVKENILILKQLK
jgi:hypothetical protein